MCTMDVHPKGATVDQFQAMAHNIATDLGNVQMLLPILTVREPEDVATLVRAQRLLSKAYTEVLSLYAKYVPQHTHAGDHDGSPHTVNGSERGNGGDGGVRVLTVVDKVTAGLGDDSYQGSTSTSDSYDDARDVGYVNTP